MTFKRLMQTIDLSDLELSRKLFIGRATAYRWNRGKKIPTSQVMRRALVRLVDLEIEDVDWRKVKRTHG